MLNFVLIRSLRNFVGVEELNRSFVLVSVKSITSLKPTYYSLLRGLLLRGLQMSRSYKVTRRLALLETVSVAISA